MDVVEFVDLTAVPNLSQSRTSETILKYHFPASNLYFNPVIPETENGKCMDKFFPLDNAEKNRICCMS